MELLTEARDALFKRVISKTQFDCTIILENVHDPHNIGAVIRSCDAVGIRKIYVIDTHQNLIDRSFYKDLSTSTGVARWIEIERYTSVEEGIQAVRSHYDQIIATHLNAESTSVYDANLTGSLAIAFGNEHQGLTDDILQHCDANILIPQMGMVQSLNISVACAVTVFELARQRILAGKYGESFVHDNADQAALYDRYVGIQTVRRLK